MKRHYFIVIASLLMIYFPACSGNISGPSGTTSPVTITIGSPAYAPGMAAPIPSSVYKLIFTVSGKDMATITREVIVSGQASWTETFEVINGDERRFKVEAADSSGKILYQGESPRMKLDGTPVIVDIAMQQV